MIIIVAVIGMIVEVIVTVVVVAVEVVRMIEIETGIEIEERIEIEIVVMNEVEAVVIVVIIEVFVNKAAIFRILDGFLRSVGCNQELFSIERCFPTIADFL